MHKASVSQGRREENFAGWEMKLGYSALVSESTDLDNKKIFEADFGCCMQNGARYAGEDRMAWVLCVHHDHNPQCGARFRG